MPAERGEDGTPSRVDFELYDLVDILNAFARDWGGLPPLITGRSDYRILITSGVLVAAYSVQALLNHDGVIELISLGIRPARCPAQTPTTRSTETSGTSSCSRNCGGR